jgi:hypothetical protein
VADGEAAGDVCAKAALTSEILATPASTATLKRCMGFLHFTVEQASRML